MANRTRAEELAAAETIARVLGVELPVPSDINGQADLTFTVIGDVEPDRGGFAV